MENTKPWKKEYSLVLLLNILYVLTFYFIMISNA